ncbi:MAG: hypothetical protein A2Y62_08750 [Candidatus Fischerbacteria bacterium RBG_13_37_8]|uniref:Uncharacterized protein n=1 Tax=Candidatus Fischerbacteria bacterium RBG_13_37_8 TaxID=1817863 RepID=A0A1F5V827_9BACT|nr:MAG: hypothetical protein A2Y62_08750 [Candidatus Fischerbacteria bacterium RBG_13_37_8]
MTVQNQDYINRIPKLIALGLFALYFLWCAITPGRWHFIDGVNLAVHEGGHVILSFMGEFIEMAAGSLMQLLIPAAFVIYFFYRGQRYSGSLVLMWLGQSFINLSVYVGDAVVMELPLVGGGIHDWNYLLERMHLLSATPFLAFMARATGTLIILAGIVLAYHYTKSEENESL